jgi:tetratricopeptide (TPR) repeat protein
LTDSIASFKPLALAMGLMSLLPLLKKKQQNLFVFIIIITSFVSTEYIYNIEDYAINHSVVITADDTETKAAEQTDEIKVLTPYHNVLVESRNQLEKTATICRIQLIYLQKMVFPLALIHQYGTRQIELADWNDWDVYLSILLHLLLLLMAVYFYKKNFPVVTWGIVWYFLTMSIYTNIIRLLPDTLAERFLFLPSIGFSIALVSAIYFHIQRIQLNERKSLITLSLLLAPVFAYYTFKTVDRTKDWKSNYTLAANTLPNAENNAAINAQYALELNGLIGTGLFSNADSAEALVVKHYKKAIEIYPDFYGPNADLASYYILNAEPDSAFPYLLESYRIKPEQWLHHYYLGLIYFEKNNYQESFKFFDKIVENELLQADKNEYPELLEAYEFAGRCLHNMGRDQEAYVYLQNGINAYQNKSTYILLANLYRVTGKTNLAIQTFEDFLVLNPGDQEIINTIEYLKQGLIY